VSDIYHAGQQKGYRGFLSLLGNGTLITMKRHAYLRGETATLQISCFGSADRGELVAINNNGKKFILKEFSPADKTITVNLTTRDFRPGKYTIKADLYRKGDKIDSGKAVPLIIRSRRQPEFPVGLGSNFNMDEESLSIYENLPVSFLTCNAPQGDLYFPGQLDRAFAHGLCLLPNFNILDLWGRGYTSLKKKPYFEFRDGKMRVNRDKGWEFLQTLVYIDGTPDDHRSLSSASPFSPIARKMMLARIQQILALAGNSPALWMVSFQDEVPFRLKADKQTRKLKAGDYSYYAIEHFKNKTGLDKAVFPPVDKPGTVWPDDHSYLKWIRHIGLPGNDFTTVGFDNLYHQLGQEIKKSHPDTRITNYSGAEYGLLDMVLDWNYPFIWDKNLWNTTPGIGLLDFVFDRHRARQQVRPRKPIGALLGWWTGDMSTLPDWCVADFNINTELALAKGNKQISWFSAGRGPKQKKSGPFSRPDLKQALTKWCRFLQRKGALFARLEKRPYHKTAVLWSKVNRAGHVHKTSWKGEYYNVYAGLRNCGANPDLVTDSMIADGDLANYQTLVLCGFNYSSESLWGKIAEFAKTPGKLVFHDSSSRLYPTSSIPLNADYAWYQYGSDKAAEKWGEGLKQRAGIKDCTLKTLKNRSKWRSLGVPLWAKYLESVVMPKLPEPDLAVLNSTGQISPHLLWSGNTPCLFIINMDLEQRRSATIRLKHQGKVAYDIETGTESNLQSNNGRVEFKLKLEPGAWKAYLLPENKMTAISVNSVLENNKVRVSYAVRDRAGALLKTAWPVKVELLDPAGNKTSYIRQTSTEKTGSGEVIFQLGRLTDTHRNWKVQVTDELSGRQAMTNVEVK